MRTSLKTCCSLHRFAALVVAFLAAFCATQAEASVVVTLDTVTLNASADYSMAASTADARSQPLPDRDEDAQRRVLLVALASSPTDGGIVQRDNFHGRGHRAGVASLVCDLPQRSTSGNTSPFPLSRPPASSARPALSVEPRET